MEKRQIIAAVAMITVFIGALVVAAYYGQGGPAARSAGIKFKQGPRKEKTVVNESLYNKLVGSEVVAGPDETAAAATEKSGEGETEAFDTKPATPEEAAEAEAFNALTPELGIEKLAALLAALENLENASRLYTALGTLYTQTGEGGALPAEEAFAAAQRLARTQEDRHRAALAYVVALSARGETERAVREADAALTGEQPASLPGMRLGIAQGRLYEQQGAPDKAEASYKRAMEQAKDAAPVLRDDAVSVYRQACLLLVQLYRKTNREAQANSLVITMKQTLARLER